MLSVAGLNIPQMVKYINHSSVCK